jgi:hypothetical protein
MRKPPQCLGGPRVAGHGSTAAEGSMTTMTDAPFVSAMNAAILFYVRWVKQRRAGDLSLGSVAVLLMFPVQQPGAVLALIP